MYRKLQVRLTTLFILIAMLVAACGNTPRAANTPAPTAVGQAAGVESTSVPTIVPTTAVAAASQPTSSAESTTTPAGVRPAAPKRTGKAGSTKVTLPARTKVSTTAPTSTPTRAPIAAQYGLPVRLVINTPQVHVDAAVEYVGLTPDGAMDVPKRWEDVAWYDRGPRPGEVGNSVVAGHLDSTTGPAVFWRLKDLHIGDKVSVVDENGKTITFKVTKTDSYTNDNAPLQEIFGPWNSARLNLITCDGAWNPDKKQYNKKLVVYTEKVS